MYKVMAVLRTLYLLFAVGYTVKAMPVFSSVAGTFDEQYARCSAALNHVVRAAWFAVAWIAFETVVGWLLVRYASRHRAHAVAEPAPTSPRP